MTKAEARARDNSYSRQYRNGLPRNGNGKNKPEEKGVSEKKLPKILALLKELTGFTPPPASTTEEKK